MPEQMSDAEVVATFMEPRPQDRKYPDHEQTWWTHDEMDWRPTWFPAPPTLDALHEVEAKLTDEQWWGYEAFFCRVPFEYPINNVRRVMLHASAGQKLAALAAVLRPTVEAKTK